MSNHRIERDSMGELAVPAEALYGAQTQRAVNNFPVSGQRMPAAFVRALILAKAAAARANVELGQLAPELGDAIAAACRQLLEGDFMQHFPVDVFQTGSGTSTNMNANEVIATLASRILGDKVSPNDHVNCGQSSNDIIPSTIHVSAAIELSERLLPALEHLSKAIGEKSREVHPFVKTGRTHLMDAMPVRMSQVLDGWAHQIRSNIEHLTSLQPSLHALAQGGTAVGTGINAHPRFSECFCTELKALTGLSFTPGDNLFALIGSQDTAVALSGQLKTTAVSLMKIANDLRWMNSGPLAGLAEIELEALQPGSSIMPGKVNPVIPEATAMVAAQVIGNDATIAVAGQSGNFELNVMLPVIAQNLLHSIQLLGNVSHLLADRAIATFKVNQPKLKEALDRNPILVTALNPLIGYLKAAEIAKLAYKEGRPIIEVALEHTEFKREELEQLLDPEKLTEGGL
ncbi:fumarate hydratase [Azotobacter vinelandii CA]|uniref:Fumarate hydratase class II n=2 Tax=Azotobacter vinelandii TaxID=354 RepID=C1DJX3_AZOVD|nr:class II fumarate hydratase FumC [Azotobacter vinelandii]ACO78892.1 Fumarate hydratase class II protein [Azotobacter vinelandii DJ]AGK12806.1 fumarate hydratase [Azotobacter vinelandii CA]AGK17959.1 fumarate hydratase [Azotobacter vinelandii CA6]WKN19890.1 class II fumarate hydratase FumC [Azotobacter vinelandii]SFY16915.1 fumarase, class II [Azotobacter vinelandii]